MPGTEVLKSYLVKIGWDLEGSGFSNLQVMIGKLKQTASASSNQVVQAGAIITKTILGITSSVVGLVSKTADLDLESAKLSRQWWTSKENANALNISLEAMDTTMDGLLTSTKEEYSHFLELNRLAKSLEAPSDVNKTLAKVRDLTNQLDKLKVIGTYAKRWFSYYIGRYFGTEIDKLRAKAKNAIEWLSNNIAKYTELAARHLKKLYDFVDNLVYLFKNFFSVFKTGFDESGNSLFGFMRTAAFVGAAIKKGPLMLALGSIISLLLLLEDYSVWKQGGNSFYGSTWEKLDPAIEGITDKVGTLLGYLSEITKSSIVKKILDGTVAIALYGVQTILDLINSALQGILDFMDMLQGKKTLKEWFLDWTGIGGMKDGAQSFFEKFLSLNPKTSWISKLLNLTKTDPNSAAFGGSGRSSNTTNNKTDVKYDVKIQVGSEAQGRDVADAFTNQIFKNRSMNQIW